MYDDIKGKAKLAFLLAAHQERGLLGFHMTGTSEGYSGWVHVTNRKTGEKYNIQEVVNSIPDGAVEQCIVCLDPANTLDAIQWEEDFEDALPDEALSPEELERRHFLQNDLAKQIEASREYITKYLTEFDKDRDKFKVVEEL